MINITAWIFDVKSLIHIFSDQATMKVNTSIAFILLSLSILFKIDRNNKIASVITSIILLLLTSYTYLSYSFPYFPSGIDNIIVFDKYSVAYPGRMSPATAISFILSALSILMIIIEDNKTKFISLFANVTIIIFGLISVISFLYQLELTDKSFFFRTMSIPTSLMFITISSYVLIKNNYSIINELFFSNYLGSKVFLVQLYL